MPVNNYLASLPKQERQRVVRVAALGKFCLQMRCKYAAKSNASVSHPVIKRNSRWPDAEVEEGEEVFIDACG